MVLKETGWDEFQWLCINSISGIFNNDDDGDNDIDWYSYKQW